MNEYVYRLHQYMNYLLSTEKGKPRVNTTPKTGRNEPCPCGSFKKFKRCCLAKA